jgi:hypothetical protein
MPAFNKVPVLERNLAILVPFLQLFVSTVKKGVRLLVSGNASTDDMPLVAKGFDSEYFPIIEIARILELLKNFNQSAALCDLNAYGCLVTTILLLSSTWKMF